MRGDGLREAIHVKVHDDRFERRCIHVKRVMDMVVAVQCDVAFRLRNVRHDSFVLCKILVLEPAIAILC